MPVAWGAIIGEIAQAGITDEVGRLEGDRAAGGIANQVMPQRGHRATAIGRPPGRPRVQGDERVL